MLSDVYIDTCSICGYEGKFEKDNPSFREGYQCVSCRASLRYRGQAGAILKVFARDGEKNLKELAENSNFRKLYIYEPGLIGPFRNLFSSFENYFNSFYWDNVDLGSARDGVQCESLEKLTYDDDQFGLIISSDIMEHVRRPWVAFSDIYRVLKPGGYHIFSIPVHLPMPLKTKFRVDTSTDDDVYLEEPRYHGNGVGGRSLVYTDFGADISHILMGMGYKVTLDTIDHSHPEVRKLITFTTQKPISN